MVSDAKRLSRCAPDPAGQRHRGVVLVTAMLSTAEEVTMAKLTDTQLMLLSRASQRDDGAAVVPDRMNKAAAAKVAASLVGKKLMREVRARPGVPVWRQDENGRALSLIIMRAGRDTVDIDETSDKGPLTNAADEQEPQAVRGDQLVKTLPRAGTKQALIVSLLSGRSGASINELMAATGWLAHTTRAALTGLRQRGYVLERTKQQGHPTSWRIAYLPMSGQLSAASGTDHLDRS